jgi:hypothetical protein
MHYPGHLRDAFCQALDAHLFQDDTDVEEDLFWSGPMQHRWAAMDTDERLMWVSGKLWHCTDIMPGELCEVLDMEAGSTYAQACRRIRQGLVRPLRTVGVA